VDGKYLRVEPHERKILVVYGVDYLTHDLPGYRLCTSENYPSLKHFFASLKLAGYPLIALVCDDNRNIYQACLAVYPKAIIQLCTKHFVSGVYDSLDVRNNPQYGTLISGIAEIFRFRRTLSDVEQLARKLYQVWATDERAHLALLELARKLPYLTGYVNYPNIPLTTNLIEGLNSHLEARLTGIRKFQSFRTADLWLNAYFLRRRLTPFTDCSKKFRRLNGTTSLEQVLNDKANLEHLKRLIR
jgi:transposase-like protein